MDRWASIPSRWLVSFKLDARRRFRAQTPWRRDAASLSLTLTLTSLRRPRPSSTDRQHNDVTRTAKDDAISGVMHCRPRRRLRHHLRRCRRRWRPVGPSISPRFRLQSRDSLEFSASSRSTGRPRGSFRRGSPKHVAVSRYYPMIQWIQPLTLYRVSSVYQIISNVLVLVLVMKTLEFLYVPRNQQRVNPLLITFPSQWCLACWKWGNF